MYISTVSLRLDYSNIPKNNIAANFIINKMELNTFQWTIPMKLAKNIYLFGLINSDYTFQFFIPNILSDKVSKSFPEFRTFYKYLIIDVFQFPNNIDTRKQLRKYIYDILITKINDFFIFYQNTDDRFIQLEMQQLSNNINYTSLKEKKQVQQLIKDMLNY